jgi:hypothetical protein
VSRSTYHRHKSNRREDSDAAGMSAVMEIDDSDSDEVVEDSTGGFFAEPEDSVSMTRMDVDSDQELQNSTDSDLEV